VLDLQGRGRCRGCGARGRAGVSIKRGQRFAFGEVGLVKPRFLHESTNRSRQAVIHPLFVELP
jgi:hypothetical protein